MNYTLVDSSACAPTRKHSTDAGIDLYCNESKIIPVQEFAIIRTGIRIDVPKGYMLQIWPKSKADFLIGAGIVDQDYKGEILVKVFNGTKYPLGFGIGTPVAQAVLVPTIYPELIEVTEEEFEQEKTERGISGGICEQI
jgi:dUTP pyrophosphatase